MLRCQFGSPHFIVLFRESFVCGGMPRIRIDGDVELVIDVAVAPDHPQPVRTAQGLSTTGFHCVNAVPTVCEAPHPGIKTFLDLHMITGRMGTHRTPR